MFQRSEPNNFPGGVIDYAQPAGTRILIVSTAALTAIASLTTEYVLPQDSTIRRVFQTNGARQMGLEVFGTGADNAGWQARVYGLRRYQWGGPRPTGSAPADVAAKFPDIWRPRPLIDVNGKLGTYTLGLDANALRDPLTAGAAAAGSIGLVGGTVRGTDVWEIDADYTYADTAMIVHEGTNGFAAAVFDPMGCDMVAVELSCDDPDDSGNATGVIPFMYRL